MRILAVRGENLASLARSFAIEFASGPLADVGLFAITGPVGAGKSTLLDAICLALYDRTPRLSGRGGPLIGDEGQQQGDWLRASDPRTLLRRNAIEGFAETDFVGRDGVVYRSRWSVRRARRRADGRLQDQQLVLTRVRDDVVVAGGRRSEVLQAIKLRLGLEFEQFCRSVLLAQGQFHAFLYAKADERARLLETLTGAQLYRKLSRAAHQRRREHEARVALLRSSCDQLNVLPTARREELLTERQRLQREVEVCEIAETLASRYVTWHEQARKHLEAEERAQQALRQALRADADAEERRKQQSRHERALQALPRLEMMRERKATASKRRAELAACERAVSEAHARLQAAVAALAALLPPELVAAGEIAGGMHPLPPLLANWPAWQESVRRWVQLRSDGGAVKRELPKLQTRLEAARQQAMQLGAEGQGLAAAADKARQQLAAQQAAASAGEEQALVDRRRKLGAAQLETQQLADGLASLVRRTQAASEVQRQVVVASAKAEEQRQRSKRAVSQLAVTERALQAARAAAQRLRQRHDLRELRAQLVDGEECPLCGSGEHPAAGHDAALDSVVAAADASVAVAERDDRVAQSDAATAAAECEAMVREQARLAELARQELAAVASLQLDLANAAGLAAGQWIELDAVIEKRQAAHARDAEELAVAEKLTADKRRARDRMVEQSSKAETALADWRRRFEAAGEEERKRQLALQSAQTGLEQALAVRAELEQQLLPALGESTLHESALHESAGGIESLRRWTSDGLEQLEQIGAAEAVRASACGEAERCVAARAAVADRFADAERDVATAEQALLDVLKLQQVDVEDVEVAGRRGLAALQAEAHELQQLRQAVDKRRTELTVRTDMRRQHEDHGARPSLDLDEARLAYRDAQKQHESVKKHQLDVLAELEVDDRMQKQRDELQPRLQAQERELGVWQSLDDLIGSSGGDAFARYAQGLTLELLLIEANRRLQDLARRYRLEKVVGESGGSGHGGDMDFVVVDLDMGGTRRSLNTLSGGETFLVSLALALALATLAAPTARVETLFLDEGFGTLDAHSLEIALGALDSLQATGCQVGIISHVDGIAERIGAVVEVRPEGSGQSRVLVQPAS
ncbi:MAG: AAA family ATPase [Planctomycetota bacterium]